MARLDRMDQVIEEEVVLSSRSFTFRPLRQNLKGNVSAV